MYTLSHTHTYAAEMAINSTSLTHKYNDGNVITKYLFRLAGQSKPWLPDLSTGMFLSTCLRALSF